MLSRLICEVFNLVIEVVFLNRRFWYCCITPFIKWAFLFNQLHSLVLHVPYVASSPSRIHSSGWSQFRHSRVSHLIFYVYLSWVNYRLGLRILIWLHISILVKATPRVKLAYFCALKLILVIVWSVHKIRCSTRSCMTKWQTFIGLSCTWNQLWPYISLSCCFW